ncbi:hypothetical protein [Actinomadura sp. DC4]|uniref:hypothetical protein n=1 Tax=Actinomadura sp. DC4 TaxID=3055069 RepID=UPI0025B04152|nr:hypothetical protein [Actinomadura sp. DC4]MDN3356084.1 hypothetical protein [Actinomadura sp. DC4]
MAPKLVKIVHPDAGESMVPETAVPHWRRAGWAPASEVEQADNADNQSSPNPDPASAETSTSGSAGDESQKDKPAARGRRSEGGK